MYSVIVDGIEMGMASSKVAAYWYVQQWILMGRDALFVKKVK